MSSPKIIAEFIRDHKERLIGIKEIDIIHYSIKLSIKGLLETPEKVIYQLDESYGLPKIAVKAPPEFVTEITSYGDYDLKAHLHYVDRIETLTTNLYKSLEDNCKETDAPEIKQALEQIKRL